MPAAATKKMQPEELKLLTSFVDLLERALELDPLKRLTPKEALSVRSHCRIRVHWPELIPSLHTVFITHRSIPSCDNVTAHLLIKRS